jgi:hypothetical protein
MSPRAIADDPWNPFAEQDTRSVRSRPDRQPPANRGSYLAPMTPADTTRVAPYPEQVRRGEVPFTPNGRPPPVTPYAPGPASPGSSSPFDSRPGTYQPPSAGENWAPETITAGTAVERGELSPVMNSAAASPAGVWAGLDAPTSEQLLAPVRLPPASPAMSDLLNRLLASPVADPRLELVRVATLWRSGAALDQPPSANLASAAAERDATAATAALLLSKIDLAAGRGKDACIRVKETMSQAQTQASMPAAMRGEAIVIAGYCAIAAGNPQAGTLAVELARDSGFNRPFTIALLEAVSAGTRPNVSLTGPATLVDGLLALSAREVDPGLIEQLIANATPALLGFLTRDDRLPAALALTAAERAAAMNVITPARLAEIYRAQADGGTTGTPAGGSPAGERAALFASAERTDAQFQKTRAIRALLDSARRDGLYHPVAVALTPIVGRMRPAQEISWFAETAVETLAAGGDYQGARGWVAFSRPFEQGGGNLDHWLMLIDLADADLPPNQRGQGFRALEDLAARGRFSPEALHRLATTLDALDYNIPIPLWDLASRTGQPQGGHLPETGILSALKVASGKRQQLATTLFALRTVAPEGGQATHLLGLGETIRSLKRAGLEQEARRLAFEALFADWPRAEG